MRPATTGDTEKGRSIRVTRKVLPGKSNLAIAQAAAMPNTVLSGTAMAAATSDSRTAARVSGSVIEVQKAGNALGEGFLEHDHKRQHQQHHHEQDGDGPQCEDQPWRVFGGGAEFAGCAHRLFEAQ